MGRAKAGVAKTGKGDVEVIRADPEALQNEGLFDSDSLDVNANVPLLDLLSAMNANDADGTVTVSKVITRPGGAREEEWLFSGQPSGDLLNDLQQDYGPGKYTIKVYSRDADGVKAIRANKSITIGALPASKAAKTEVAVVAPAQDRFTEFMAQQATIAAQREQHMFSLIQAIVTSQRGGNDQLSGFKTFAESVGLMQKNAPAAPGPLDMLGALQSMLKMVRDLTPSATDAITVEGGGENAVMLQAMQMFGKVLEMARESRQAQPGALEMAQAPNYPQPPRVAQTPAQPRPAPLAAHPGNGGAPAVPAVPQTPEERQMLMLKLFMQNLIDAARANEPVDGYADQIEAMLDDDGEKMLRSPEWFAALCSVEPDAAPHQAWFATLREALIKLIDDESGPLDDIPPAKPAGPSAVN